MKNTSIKCLDLDTTNLVIGGGIAGLTTALKLAKYEDVVLISKGPVEEANSYYAQGGIASVLSETDSFKKHVEDTLVAGAGLCHKDIVEIVVEKGPQAIRELVEIGVEFTRNENKNSYHLTKEGGHSERRVIHANDLTGKVVMEALIDAVKKSKRITLFENQFAIDLITTDKFAPDFSVNRCLGAYILDRASDSVFKVIAARTVVATGGHGRVYLYTSNPDLATGDGVAMSWRAGCKVSNMEFMQFHPTCLYHPEAKTFLISEALRGEGAVLRNSEGEDFTKKHSPLGSLAPRDIVARAIDSELKSSGATHVFLDARAIAAQKLESHFPNILNTCLSFGIDIRTDLIPVVPAAHYSCGGVVVDGSGRTSISGLYALGEVACTGLHGANRLASNSLLEALVFSDLVFKATRVDKLLGSKISIPDWDHGKTISPDEQVVLSHTWDEIRRLMWNYVGIVRTDKRLKRAFSRIKAIREELDEYYWNYRINDKLLEVRNLAEVAYLTVKCAIIRKESRGIHFTLDYPAENQDAKDTVVW